MEIDLPPLVVFGNRLQIFNLTFFNAKPFFFVFAG
jgi:hypothetical protein